MNDETDIQREIAAERACSVQTKASFLVVIACLLASASFETSVTISLWWLSTAPLGLALGTVIAAIIAPWPAAAGAIDPENIRSTWIDGTQNSYELEIYLLRLKMTAYAAMQTRTTTRVTALKIEFVLLSAAIASALAVFIIQRIS